VPLGREAQGPKTAKARKRAPSKKKAAPDAGAGEEAKTSASKAPRKSAKRSPRKKAGEEQLGE
jgi:hypothetical protein